MGSATPMRPAGFPSTATNMTVWPCDRPSCALAIRSALLAPSLSIIFSLPMATRRFSAVASTPSPVTEPKSVAASKTSFRSLAPATIAAASGCSLAISIAATNESILSASKPASGSTDTSFGLPSVRVPVLSTTMVSIFSNVSSASAFLIKIPF